MVFSSGKIFVNFGEKIIPAAEGYSSQWRVRKPLVMISKTNIGVQGSNNPEKINFKFLIRFS